MKLNGTVQCDGYEPIGKDGVLFMLSGATIAQAAAIEPPYIVYRDDGETVAADFTGMECTGVYLFGDSGSVQLRAARELSTDAREAIRAVEGNLTALTATVDAVDGKADTAQAAAETAQQAAEQAQASASPAVRAASALYVNASTALTNSQLGDVRDLIEDFVQGGEYAKGAIRRYDGKYWRMAQDINSTTSQTYLPGTGTESLYTLIDLAPDGIRIWHTPTDATNSFALGEKAHYPDAEGPVYVSKRNGNTSEPGTDQWWELAE